MSTRRDLFKFVGGAAAGAVLTPVPWRLIADAARWSQNWPGIPHPARGPITTRFTHCALCSAGCAIQARCVSGQPVFLSGAQCALGVTGHHLPYYPGRLKEGPAEVAAASVANAIEKCGPNEHVAVLDLRPGRTASWTHRRAMAAIKNGLYLVPSQPEDRAYDLSKARLVLSIGVPFLEDWGTPGNVLRARAGFRLIQADPLESRTANLADTWLRIRPGSERALVRALIARAPAEETGLTEKQILDLADELASTRPALVLADAPEAVALNKLTGAWGSAIVARREAPVPESWRKAAPVSALDSAPDGSIRALLIDESVPDSYIPWSAIERKLVRDNPVVVTFASTREGYGRHALFALPAAVFPELLDDLPPAIDSPAATFRISTPLVEAPAGMVNPAAFIAAAAKLTLGDPLRERVEAIRRSGRGTFLREGVSWIDSPAPAAPPPGSAGIDKQQPAAGAAGWPLMAVIAEMHGSSVPASPLTTKLTQESNLMLGRNRVALHPDSARASGLKDNGKAVFETTLGRCPVAVVIDASVPPGMVAVAAAPEVLDICGAAAPAKVVPA